MRRPPGLATRRRSTMSRRSEPAPNLGPPIPNLCPTTCPTSGYSPWASAQPSQPSDPRAYMVHRSNLPFSIYITTGQAGWEGWEMRDAARLSWCPTSARPLARSGQVRSGVRRGRRGTLAAGRHGACSTPDVPRGSSPGEGGVRVARPQFACTFRNRVWFRWYRGGSA
jgi:hypothetical protein